jgi:hypothetical protein
LARRFGITDPAQLDAMAETWKKAYPGGAIKSVAAQQKLKELLAQGKTGILDTLAGTAPKEEGLLSKLSPVGLGQAIKGGKWGTVAGKLAPIGAGLLGLRWLANQRRERQAAGAPLQFAPTQTSSVGL